MESRLDLSTHQPIQTCRQGLKVAVVQADVAEHQEPQKSSFLVEMNRKKQTQNYKLTLTSPCAYLFVKIKNLLQKQCSYECVIFLWMCPFLI